MATINDEKLYDGLPEYWVGKDASFAMLVDWITYSRRQAKKDRLAAGDDAEGDPISLWIDGLIEIAIARNYPARCMRELEPLVDMADRERSGVLGTLDQGLIPFKNQAVAQRTMQSDFVPADLGGRLTATAVAEFSQKFEFTGYPRTREQWAQIQPFLRREHWEPVTVFVCINQAKARAFENLTSLFFEVLTTELLSYGPGEVTARGWVMGPFPTGFNAR